MTHVTCRLTAKNWDQLRNPIVGARVWATFTFTFISRQLVPKNLRCKPVHDRNVLVVVSSDARCEVCVCVGVRTDREQMEHGSDWSDDVLPRGGRQHAGAAGPARQVREQDPDAHQDRPQLEDAEPVPAGRVLHSEGARRSWHAVDGTRADPAVGPALVQADGRRHHALPVRHEPRGGPADPEPLQVACAHDFSNFLNTFLLLIQTFWLMSDVSLTSFTA